MKNLRNKFLLLVCLLVVGGGYAFYRGLTQQDPRERAVSGSRAAPGDADPQLADPRAQAGQLFPMHGGFWIRRRDAGVEAPKVPDELLTLPYVAGSRPQHAMRGVTVYDATRAQDGLNLMTSAHAAVAYLLDMRGDVLHQWAYERDRVWPHLADHDRGYARKYFRRVHLFDDGDLLAIYEYTGLIRLDVDSKLLWSHQGWNHHDLDVDDRGRIVALGSEDKEVPALRNSTITADNITILASDGAVLDKLEIADCLLASPYAKLIDLARRMDTVDVFHTNTVQILDGAHAARSPAFAKGNLLISMRNMSALGIIDPQQRKFVWAAWGPWRMQHEPVLLPNGNMLLFDNQTLHPGQPPDSGSSRVLEFDPLERKIVWQYVGTPERPFYSSLCGAASRLRNGNTLVTESDYGRVFEVTPAKDLVWEFKNPHVTGPNDEFVALIPELIRLPVDFPRWSIKPR